jgi:biotin carboxylase
VSRPVVVIVDPYSSGVLLAPDLRAAGFTVVAVLTLPSPARWLTDGYCPDDFDMAFGPTDDADALSAQLAPLAPVAVVPGTESGVALAGELAARLTPQRACPPASALARRHKGVMVQTLASAGIDVPRSRRLRDPEEMGDWLSESGLDGRDLVIKPVASAATAGVTLAEGGRGWADAVRRLCGSPNLLGGVNEEVLVQERMLGTEYVVDTFSHDGRHAVADICRYVKVRNAGHFAVYESMTFLPYDKPAHDELLAYTRRVLDALGMRFGFAHTEVMLTADGPRLVEMNARLGGGGLPWTCRLATGQNAIDWLIAHLRGDEPPERYTLKTHVTVVFFMAPQTGRVRDVAVLEEIRRLPSCARLHIGVREGEQVAASGDLASTLRVGWAILAHADAGQVRADHAAARRIAGRLRVDPVANLARQA